MRAHPGKADFWIHVVVTTYREAPVRSANAFFHASAARFCASGMSGLPSGCSVLAEVATLPIWQEAGPPARPLLIVASDPEADDAAKTAPCCALFRETHGIDYACVPETGHLLQLEEPERCFALFDDFLASHGIAE